MKNEWVKIGYIQKAHGLKGQIWVRSYLEDPQTWDDLKTIYVETKSEPLPFSLVSIQSKNEQELIVALHGITDRNQSELLEKKYVFIKRSELPKPAKNEVFLDELIGFFVVDKQTNQILGIVKEIEKIGLQSMLVVSEQNTSPLLIPATEIFLYHIDTIEKKITATLPEGYIEIYRSE